MLQIYLLYASNAWPWIGRTWANATCGRSGSHAWLKWSQVRITWRHVASVHGCLNSLFFFFFPPALTGLAHRCIACLYSCLIVQYCSCLINCPQTGKLIMLWKWSGFNFCMRTYSLIPVTKGQFTLWIKSTTLGQRRSTCQNLWLIIF